ncbi:MAG: YdcH family protein [Gammaproteobacteria bacterium]|jgi:hypothetical protein|nr:YdcH family protein [Gammaproteobacteria bacterium]
MLESEKQALQRLLEELLLEHRDLDDIIDRLQTSGSFDPLQLQRMKKRKLRLKDQISQIENQLIPDILA